MVNKRRRVVIRPELSAQGIRKHPNPMLQGVFGELVRLGFVRDSRPLVVDCGCGQLRNVESLLSLSPKLVLVDTPYQLEHKHEFFGEQMTIPAIVEQRWPRKQISIMSTDAFGRSSIHADIIFSINVLDVTPPKTRAAMLHACQQNLTDAGAFVAVAPRNDVWTLRICTPEAKYGDGYVFPHRCGYTYYRNWSGDGLHTVVEQHGFRVTGDLSIYRYVCLICTKEGRRDHM